MFNFFLFIFFFCKLIIFFHSRESKVQFYKQEKIEHLEHLCVWFFSDVLIFSHTTSSRCIYLQVFLLSVLQDRLYELSDVQLENVPSVKKFGHTAICYLAENYTRRRQCKMYKIQVIVCSVSINFRQITNTQINQYVLRCL